MFKIVSLSLSRSSSLLSSFGYLVREAECGLDVRAHLRQHCVLPQGQPPGVKRTAELTALNLLLKSHCFHYVIVLEIL